MNKSKNANVEVATPSTGEINSNSITLVSTSLTEQVGPTIADYVTEAKKEMSNKITKVDNKVAKSKTINVKYFCDFIPENKKDPMYEKAMNLVPHYAHDGDIGMDIVLPQIDRNDI